MKKLLAFCFAVLFFACKENVHRTFYANGNVEKEYFTKNGKYHGAFKIYDENGRLRENHIYANGSRKDSSVYYDADGQIKGMDFYGNLELIYRKTLDSIKSEGFIDKSGQAFGKWKYFNANGNINEIRDFIKVNGKAYLNRNWVFGVDGDTLPPSPKSSNYSISFFQDTIRLNENVSALFILTDPIFDGKLSEVKVILPKNKSENFNEDFSNVRTIEVDTFYNLNIEYHYREEAKLPEDDYGDVAFFGRYFTTPGTKKFRGIIVEFYNVDPDSVAADGIRSYEHKKYFEHTVFVKDTVEQN